MPKWIGLFLLLLVLPIVAHAQGAAVAIRTVTTLPSGAGACQSKTTYTEMVFKSAADATRGFYTCKDTQDGWNGPYAQSGGSGVIITATGTPANGNLTRFSGAATITNGDLSGDVTTSGTLVTTLASVITAGGPTGSATIAPIITYDAKGRLTTVSSATITPAVGSITGLGSGVATFLATPSSANLAAALTDETGTGVAVFNTAPTFSGLVTITGTTNTSANLLNINGTGTGFNYAAITNLSGGVEWGTEGSVAAQVFASTGAYDGFIGTSVNKPFHIGTNSTARVTIDTSGNVRFRAYTAGALVTDSSGNITAGTLSVANGGTNCASASITCFNNITGFSAAGSTGTTSTNLVFSASPTFTGTVALPTGVTVNGNAMTFPTTAQTLLGMNQTNTAGSSFILDASAASVTAGLKIPSAAGAVPTADGFIATNTTNHTHVWGSNGTTMVGAIAATGTGTATTCTNQFVSAVSSLAVPTCTTVTLAGAQFANQGTTVTVLHGNAAGNPSFAAVSLTADVTGTLAEGNGGTNQSTYTQGDILYASAANTLSKLAKNISSTRYLSNTGTSNNPAWAQVDVSNGVTGVLPVANGGTNASSASITAFNNITGYTASGATGTTSTNLVFSTSPTLTTPVIGAATGTSLAVTTFLEAAGGGSPSASKLRMTFGSGTGAFDSFGADHTTIGKQRWGNFSDNATAGDFFMLLTDKGNLKIGTSGADTLRGTTEPSNSISLFNGTAPAGTLTNGATFHVVSGEMKVMDSAGNDTLLSPHDLVTNEWIYESKNTVTGKSLRIDMEQMMKAINAKFGWNYVHEDKKPVVRPPHKPRRNKTRK